MVRGWTAISISAFLVLEAASVLGRSPVTSLQALITAPEQYANRAVTVTGRFRGRALADAGWASLAPPNRSRWDFLLNEGAAAVWVSGIRPAGWDFDLDPRSAADARKGPWLEVTGTVRVDGRRAPGCGAANVCDALWIQASDLRPAPAPSAGMFELPIRPATQAPIVVFNDPASDETGVAPATRVRLQFSRTIVAETFSERIRVGYTSPPFGPDPPIPGFRAIYSDLTRSLTISFATPLAPQRTVRVELMDGIVATNGRPLAPWGFAFTTGQ